jgi:hypothetical protein
MAELSTEEKLKAYRQQFLDLKEIQSRFFLTPEIQDDADFSHFDKNTLITNLTFNPRLGIDEPGRFEALSQSLHVLNNPKYFIETEIQILAGYKQEENDNGTITQIPVYRIEKKKYSNFPKTYHNLKAKIRTMALAGAVKNGWRTDKAISNKLVQENSLTEKTSVKSRFGFGRSKEDNY